MKKLFIVSALTFLFMGNVYAQQGQRTEEERAQMRAEMIKRVADRSAKDFDLKGDAKETFLTTFTAYQTEMFQTNMGGMRQRGQEADEKKELTDEEAVKQLNIILDRLDDSDDVQAVYHNWDE